jgi:hypothetical protein
MVPRCKRHVRQLMMLLAVFAVISFVSQFILIPMQKNMLDSEWYQDMAQETFGLSFDYLRSKRLIIWTNDVHPAPAADVRSVVKDLGVEILEFNLGGPEQCQLFNVCDGRKKIKVLFGSWKC